MTFNPDRSRFEINTADDRRAGIAEYVDHNDVRDFTHTEIDDQVEGRGWGSALVREALDRTRAEGMKVKASCPFVRSWIDRHPDYQDLLA